MRVSGHVEDVSFSYFPMGLQVPDPVNFLTGCVLWNTDKEYLSKLSAVIKRIDQEENMSVLENEVFREFENIISNVDYKTRGDSNFLKYIVVNRTPVNICNISTKGGNADHKQVARFYRRKPGDIVKLFSAEVAEKPQQFSHQRYPKIGIVKLNTVERGQLSYHKKWQALKEIIRLYQQNTKYSDYFSVVNTIVEIMEQSSGSRELPLFMKLFEYLVPFDFITYEGCIFVKPRLFERKKVLSELMNELRSGGRKTFNRNGQYDGKWKDLLYGLGQRLSEKKDERFMRLSCGKTFQDLFRENTDMAYSICEEWIQEFLKEHTFKNEFLKNLRSEWVRMIEFPDYKIKNIISSVFFHKSLKEEENVAWISYGEFSVPFKEMNLVILYEDKYGRKVREDQTLVNIFAEKLKRATQSISNYIGNININVSEGSFIDIREFIPFFESLKKVDPIQNDLDSKSSLRLLFSLLVFYVKLKKMLFTALKEGKPVAVLFALDTQKKDEKQKKDEQKKQYEKKDEKKEGSGYLVWDYYRMLYEKAGFPAQTLNRDVIDKLIRGDSQLNFVLKNTFISFLKDYKTLHFKYDNINVPDKIRTVYVVVEQPSSGFFYSKNPKFNLVSRHHYILNVYKVDIDHVNKYVQVSRGRDFLLLYGGLDADTNDFKSWIESIASQGDVAFFFVNAKDAGTSYVRQLLSTVNMDKVIEEKSIFVDYASLPLAYVSSGKGSDQNGLLIYSSEMKKAMSELGVKVEEDKFSLGIKLLDPISTERFQLDNNTTFYHASVQVFTTKGVGWEKTIDYDQRKGLFLISMISLFQYDSEAFQIPYSGISILQKQKSHVLNINRNGITYKVPLNSVIYELQYLVEKIPVGEPVI